MIILRSKEFSRHTPDNLKKYKKYEEEDIAKMTRGQKLRALEEEDETARDNTRKYVHKKWKKYIPIGAGVGAVGGALIAPKGSKVIVGANGALAGGLAGLVGGEWRGTSKAAKEGHDRDKRSIKLARRFDDYARKKHKEDDDYEFRVKDNIKARRAAEDARAARDMATATYLNTL